MQLYIVVTRLACIAFSTAAFVLAMAAPESQQFSFVVALKGSMLTQLSWTSMRMLYQAICWYFGEVHLDRIAPVLFNDMLVMLLAYGASCAGAASVLFLYHNLYCDTLGSMACPMYMAASVFGLVAAFFNTATTLRLLWARCSRHHED
ncbi:uncharacterized protein LOC123429899 [Hordeum vulgare subsp. vulgare]|uniref:CASP-like protein n=1 Tax=Hordeum vulgare subsp. vulgare TaxID=112509 RepID=A0A8I6X028_HORVV|nr:uncharacterized protein LOC123429899 [Hordeum vulgare subsp. vulgare]